MDEQGVRGDKPLPCCGHWARFHTPMCEYWIPGTRDQIPRPCGCEAMVSESKPEPEPELRPDVTR